ncbi:MAG: 16S rRNA (guanine(966)-N(2))-methyltransferase RsmD [Lachnospiraceae bacterium]|nr:16S rRNA (guanine(966)-N(2))-methyltransferase RsmD [Lachnospiraceae bacterium]
MRVIAGKARHIQRKTIEGMDTRPTTDRIKETLFNMINNDVIDCSFLDLFSGSGAIGIEALSRGARKAVLVEKSREAVGCIRENLTKTKLTDSSVVYQCDVMDAIQRLDSIGEPFDIVFMDPPYDNLYEKQVLEALKDTKLVDEYTTIIVEASLQTSFDYLDSLGYKVYKRKEYKTNVHMFITLK